MAPSSASSRTDGTTQAVLAGVVTAVVGFTSSFAVVLTGLAAVGTSAGEAVSGLLVLSLTMGMGTVLFSWRSAPPSERGRAE